MIAFSGPLALPQETAPALSGTVILDLGPHRDWSGLVHLQWPGSARDLSGPLVEEQADYASPCGMSGSIQLPLPCAAVAFSGPAGVPLNGRSS